MTMVLCCSIDHASCIMQHASCIMHHASCIMWKPVASSQYRYRYQGACHLYRDNVRAVCSASKQRRQPHVTYQTTDRNPPARATPPHKTKIEPPPPMYRAPTATAN
uniref:Uncharacterized protein n=1 Tax=Lotharella oceanica TaxID=641309 RepID=A0A7S2U4S4_9EUKA